MRVVFIYNGAENIGIEYLSSFLKSKGHETFLIFDPAIFKGEVFINIKSLAKFYNIDSAIVKKAIELKPDIIAFSAFTGNYRWCIDIARSIKLKSNTPIVFGGVHVTAVPEKVLENEFVDFAIVGEGEYAMIDLLNNLNSKEKLIKTPNICLRYNGRTYINPPRQYIRDLDSLPFPDKELFFEAEPFFKKNPYMVMTSRGCPFSCTYCSNNMYNKLYCNEKGHVRRRSPNNVIKELLISKDKFGIKEVYFMDDIFTCSIEWLEEFVEEYKSKINLPFYCYAHPLYLNERIAYLLKMGGCRLVGIGIQSGSERIRRDIYKRFYSNERVIKAMSCLKKSKINAQIDHILGAPTETEEDLIKSIELYRKIKPEIILTFWLTYYPRVEIVKIAKELGILSDKYAENIGEGYIGYTHEFGSVPKKYISLYSKYELLIELSALIHNDKIYWVLSRIIQYFPFKKLISNAIFTLTGLRYNRTYILNKFLYVFKSLF